MGSTKRKILLQLDPDRHASSFDSVVAIDAGVDELFAYGGVQADDVEGLIHGAIFTRGPADLKSTAIFIGGKNVESAETLLGAVQRTFFGPLRTSVLLDPNGANTTAAAVALCVGKSVDVARSNALVLGGTGPVGLRVALLLARQGGNVWLSSRSKSKAEDACQRIRQRGSGRTLQIEACDSEIWQMPALPAEFQIVVAAGAAGVRLFERSHIQRLSALKVLADANAVPPTGIEGVDAMARGTMVGGVAHYGALGIGGIKMKIHKAAIASLFETNDRVLDAEAIFDLSVNLNLL